jgi:hypothetical protein
MEILQSNAALLMRDECKVPTEGGSLWEERKADCCSIGFYGRRPIHYQLSASGSVSV